MNSEITYTQAHNSFSYKDECSSIISEAADHFSSYRINVLGDGIKEVLSEHTLFDEYVANLTKGLSATDAEETAQLMENARVQTLQEATVTGIDAVASLSMPTIRKMWVRVAMKNAIPTEPVKQPKFLISYMEPVLRDADGTEHPIPVSLRDKANKLAEKAPLSTDPIAVPTTTAANLLTLAGGSVAVGDHVDPVFFIETATNGEETVRVHAAPDIRGNIYTEVAFGEAKDTLFAHIDFKTGELTVTSLAGLVTAVTVKGALTSENNSKAQSISFNIANRDVTIGTGTHLNAELPVEWLQDTMALYQIDGALEVVDLMSNTFAQKLDLEIYNFLTSSLESTTLGATASFDVRPAAGYAGTPKDWREELKTVIDHLAIQMKNNTALTNGKFVIIGNPIDMQLLTNVNWTFNAATDQRGGADVDFNLGAYSAAQTYELVSSMNADAGKMYVLFVPATNKQMTYKYYPYTFNVEKGYRSPQQTLVPSIMMTKRHTVEEFLPMISCVEILGNTASMSAELPRLKNA